MTKKPMIMGFFTAFAKLFEKYADVTAVSYTHLTLPTNSRV